jgi:predicted TPR repeat methyltransferase
VFEQQLQAAWHEVDTNWSEDGAHRRFVALCTARGELAEAARCYRRVRDLDPTRRASAEHRLEAVRHAAMSMLSRATAGTRRTVSARRSRT